MSDAMTPPERLRALGTRIGVRQADLDAAADLWQSDISRAQKALREAMKTLRVTAMWKGGPTFPNLDAALEPVKAWLEEKR